MQGIFAYTGTFSGRKMGRGFSGGYTYGFNGQMRDDEVYGEGNTYAFEYRIHDARLGRFLSVDPLAQKYPMYTTYSFCANQPIHAIELEGLESSNDLNSGIGAPERTRESLKNTHWVKAPAEQVLGTKSNGFVSEIDNGASMKNYYVPNLNGKDLHGFVAVREELTSQEIMTDPGCPEIPEIFIPAILPTSRRALLSTQNLQTTTLPALALTAQSFIGVPSQVDASINIDRQAIANVQARNTANVINDRFSVNIFFRQNAGDVLNARLINAYQAQGLVVRAFNNSPGPWNPGMDSYSTTIGYRQRRFGFVFQPGSPPILIPAIPAVPPTFIKTSIWVERYKP